MDDERWMQSVEDQLDAALAGITAPPSLAPAVLRRVRQPAVSKLPEILDSIGWLAVLLIALALLLPLAPWMENATWIWIPGTAICLPALWFGWRSTRQLIE